MIFAVFFFFYKQISELFTAGEFFYLLSDMESYIFIRQIIGQKLVHGKNAYGFGVFVTSLGGYIKKSDKIDFITEKLDSYLAQNSHVVLKQYVNRETDKYNSQGTTSSTSLAVIFHMLQTALIEETGYKNEQFALIHPGGAVGERLNK